MGIGLDTVATLLLALIFSEPALILSLLMQALLRTLNFIGYNWAKRLLELPICWFVPAESTEVFFSLMLSCDEEPMEVSFRSRGIC